MNSESVPGEGHTKGLSELLACPFCGTHLVRSEFHSNRSNEVRTHGPDIDCILSGIIITMEDREDAAERRAAWNRRSIPVAGAWVKLRGDVQRVDEDGKNIIYLSGPEKPDHPWVRELFYEADDLPVGTVFLIGDSQP